MANGNFIAYYRVSTDKQGKSGLGLEAQKQAIIKYLNGGNWTLLQEFTEVESGKLNNRPELTKALKACKQTGATLVIAKLDRLSRNVAFVSSLMDSGAEFVACDFPTANRLTIHILASMAEYEREMISKRTKDALKAAKTRGVKLGNPQNLKEESAVKGRALGVQSRQKQADDFAKNLLDLINDYLAAGLSKYAIAKKLNETKVLTARGKIGKWTGQAITNLLKRHCM